MRGFQVHGGPRERSNANACISGARASRFESRPRPRRDGRSRDATAQSAAPRPARARCCSGARAPHAAYARYRSRATTPAGHNDRTAATQPMPPRASPISSFPHRPRAICVADLAACARLSLHRGMLHLAPRC